MVSTEEFLEVVQGLAGNSATVSAAGNPGGEYRAAVSAIPLVAQACRLEIGLSRHDETFDVSLGRGMQFTEIPLSLENLREYVRAVVEGHVVEVVTEWRGRVAESRGTVTLKSGAVHCREMTSWLLLGRLLGGLKVQNIDYAPFAARRA